MFWRWRKMEATGKKNLQEQTGIFSEFDFNFVVVCMHAVSGCSWLTLQCKGKAGAGLCEAEDGEPTGSAARSEPSPVTLRGTSLVAYLLWRPSGSSVQAIHVLMLKYWLSFPQVTRAHKTPISSERGKWLEAGIVAGAHQERSGKPACLLCWGLLGKPLEGLSHS